MGWLSRLISFHGRLDRAQWWTRIAVVAALWVAQDAFVDEASLVAVARSLGGSPLALFALWGCVALWWAAMIAIAASACVRRLQDRGAPGLRLLAYGLPMAVAGHWLERFWYAWIAFAVPLAWMIAELGLAPSRDPAVGDDRAADR